MKTSFHTLTDGEMTQVKTKLGLAGFSADMAREALRDQSKFGAMVAGFNAEPPPPRPVPRPDLALELFTQPKQMIELFAQAREMCGWSEFSDRDVRLLEEKIPNQLLVGGLPWLSLRIRLTAKGNVSGVQRTFDAHVQLIKFRHEGFFRWESFKSGPDDLRLLAGNETHVPCVEWCAIDFNPLGTHSPQELRRYAHVLPADEVLAAAWLHRNLIEAVGDQGRKDVPRAMWVPGYEASAPDGLIWRDVPYVVFDRDDRRVRLDSGRCGFSSARLSVPLFREYRY